MKVGNMQRRWQELRPAVYNKETNIVCLDIKAEPQTVDVDGQQVVKQGFSFIPIEIDRQIDYGHIKSQLIEKGFAQKDEFGKIMNTVGSLIEAVLEAATFAEFKGALEENDSIQDFQDFMAFRQMCADAAHEVIAAY